MAEAHCEVEMSQTDTSLLLPSSPLPTCLPAGAEPGAAQ